MDVENQLIDYDKLANLKTRCKRAGVSCSIWDESLTRRLVHKINGPVDSDSECLNKVGACGCSHAEIRALQALKECPVNLNGSSTTVLNILCTYSPCIYCAFQITKAQIKYNIRFSTLHYLKTYRTTEGIKMLEDAGIYCISYE